MSGWVSRRNGKFSRLCDSVCRIDPNHRKGTIPTRLPNAVLINAIFPASKPATSLFLSQGCYSKPFLCLYFIWPDDKQLTKFFIHPHAVFAPKSQIESHNQKFHKKLHKYPTDRIHIHRPSRLAKKNKVLLQSPYWERCNAMPSRAQIASTTIGFISTQIQKAKNKR